MMVRYKITTAVKAPKWAHLACCHLTTFACQNCQMHGWFSGLDSCCSALRAFVIFLTPCGLFWLGMGGESWSCFILFRLVVAFWDDSKGPFFFCWVLRFNFLPASFSWAFCALLVIPSSQLFPRLSASVCPCADLAGQPMTPFLSPGCSLWRRKQSLPSVFNNCCFRPLKREKPVKRSKLETFT